MESLGSGEDIAVEDGETIVDSQSLAPDDASMVPAPGDACWCGVNEALVGLLGLKQGRWLLELSELMEACEVGEPGYTADVAVGLLMRCSGLKFWFCSDEAIEL